LQKIGRNPKEGKKIKRSQKRKERKKERREIERTKKKMCHTY
jgi:hypothetical protein